MKKYILATFLLSVTLGLFFFKKDSIPYKSLSSRKDHISKTIKETQKRMPANIVPDQKPDLVKKSKTERQWVGKKDEVISSGKIKMKNQPSSDWQSKLETILNRGLSKSTKLEVNHEKSLVLVNGHDAKNAEQVIVIFNGPDGRNSYRAMVDSQNGKVLKTWDHTIHENIRKPASLSAFPLQVNSDN